MTQDGKNWVSIRIAKALQDHPVPEAVTLAAKDCLDGELSENTLSQTELAKLARTLLDNLQEPPSGEVSNED